MHASIVPAPRPTDAHYCIARVLTNGAAPTADLAACLDLTAREVRRLTAYPWFRITGHGWDLTDRGWAELTVYADFSRPYGLTPAD